MNKYGLMFVLVLFLVIVTVTANAVSIDSSIDIANGIATQGDTTIGGVLQLMGTFFKILTFQLDDVPFIINIIFIPVTLMVVYMIIDVVKDIIPFT